MQCGSKFTLNKNEKDCYVSQSYSLPKRCSTCRKIRREDAKLPPSLDEEF